ncbi:hypothetical protein ABE137_11980 [Brevibacillus laterosporus]|uniref:hypothetical protein n=1 Tax=Brevibacillus phage Sundance TaxID=1691958 RepID=UPI0006BC0E7E|nr:hypothetical protein AVT09_gp061 [Brevibacillus phage Sundance]ALA47877.1 hypothetical protein SUNDANCE_61 [Brevibacillus phage Sundance]
MEYVIILLLVALVALLYFKQPNKVQAILSKAIINRLREKEAEIVQELYNKLPDEIRKKVDSKLIAEIVGLTIGVAIDILESVFGKSE